MNIENYPVEYISNLLRSRTPQLGEGIRNQIAKKKDWRNGQWKQGNTPGKLAVEGYLYELADRISDETMFQHAPSSEGVRIGREFISIASHDLARSKNARDSDDFPMAVYFLQQGVEKLSSGLSVSVGALEPKLPLQVDHRSPTRILKLLKSDLGGKILDVASFVSEKRYRSKLRDVNRLVNNDPEHRLYRWSTREIRHLLEMQSALNKSALDLTDVENITRKIAVDYFPEFRSLFVQYQIGSEYKNAELVNALYVLGVITFEHESETRYPTNRGGPANYNQNHPLIECFNEMHELASGAYSNAVGFVAKLAG
ncbi:MAG: hypothetical protein HOF01_03005 [Chloroflexi bacterium]|jgi:hypothetical protein|nr:hypothetical protein [Chloroflexota bacterium]